MKIPYIVDIKDNSLDDGVGIRSVVFFKGCPLRCVWCQNPEAQEVNQELIFEFDKCINCSPSCFVHCPNSAFDYETMSLNREKCMLSWDCVTSCPANVFTIAGKQYKIEELVERFTSNIVFYQNSNGGVTLSGGESMLFPKYVSKLISELRTKGINVAIETCGLFKLDEDTKKILSKIQYLYFDVKLINPKQHMQYCGTDNAKILENLKTLIDSGLVLLPKNKADLEIVAEKPYLLPRIPLIPDLTTDPKNLTDIASMLRDLDVKLIDVLPYNPLWVEKTRRIGYEISYFRETWMTSEEKSAAASYFKEFEFDTFAI